MTRTILFVCEHGAFRSRIAAAYFNAAGPRGWHALSAGRDPQPNPSARLATLLAGTAAAEHLEIDAPRRAEDVNADRVIAIDCTQVGAEQWTTIARSDEALRDEIAERVEGLARGLESSG
jgi:protein-tyrosine-phosphatase